MKRPKIMCQINDKIAVSGTETFFTPSDFFDIAEPAKVCMCLKRIADSGGLTRIMHGLYVKPGYMKPGADDIARAIARRFNWTAIPCGHTALYISGMSQRQPNEWTYVSDGVCRTYTVNGNIITFIHSEKRKEITEVSEQTALIIQALRAIGKDNITDSDIFKLAAKVKPNEKANMRFGSQKVTVWIRKYIIAICNKFYYFASHSTPDKYENHPENKNITTYFGLAVRSKSEALIATSLQLAGLEYIYEDTITDDDGQFFQPDFTVKYNGNVYYWEHAGRLNDKKYAKDWSVKEKWYKANCPEQLIVTNEKPDVGVQINKVMQDKFGFVAGASGA